MEMEPLITRYRPKSLNDVVGHGKAVERLKRYVADYKAGASALPHLFMAGPPGIGKTTIATALAADLYGPGWRQYTLNLNASDERGIGVIRGKVKDFASSIPYEQKFSLIILDECDNLTDDAQGALRSMMEEHAGICRFILCCNFANKVIDALQDRCSSFYFQPLPQEQVFNVVTSVMKAEGMTAPPDAVDAVTRVSRGSVRKALNVLSQVQKSFTKAEIDDIYPGLDLANLKASLACAFSGDVGGAESKLIAEFVKGTPPSAIFEGLFDLVEGSPLNRKSKLLLLSKFGEYDYRVAFGCTPTIQVRSLIRSIALLKEGET